ncbi:hypothetical protein MBLNU230_g5655t1 [Neophaeotheca triangularis]
MAIIDAAPGIEVTVEIDGLHLEEYRDDDLTEDPLTANRYIQAHSRKTFLVRVNVYPGALMYGNCIQAELTVDGNRVGKVNLHEDCTRIFTGVRISDSHRKLFVFSELDFTEEDETAHQQDRVVTRLGQISVKLYHRNLTYHDPPNRAGNPNGGLRDGNGMKQAPRLDMPEPVGPVTEKDVKGQALSHSIGFGDKVVDYGQPPRGNRIRKIEAIACRPNLAGNFVFKYRSKASLQALLIIPRTPSPEPLADRQIAFRQAGNLSQAEIVDMQLRLAAYEQKRQDEAKASVKRERGDDNQGPRKKARASAGTIVLELDEDGEGFHEVIIAPEPLEEGEIDEPEFIEID